MNIGKAIWLLALAGIITILLFEVNFVLDFGGSVVRQIPDPAVESEYKRCYEEKDNRIHETAFGTIDNPDVQKEFISSNQARAAAECRALYPEVMIPTEESADFNLVDLKPRFW
jgi:hypothetical protein